MQTRIRRLFQGPATLIRVVAGGMLIVILSLPLDAAPPEAKDRGVAITHQIAATVDEDQASPSDPASDPASEDHPPTIDVIKGVQTGKLSATAKGTGDGKMTLSLTNRTNTGYGNDSRQNGPLPSQARHTEAVARAGARPGRNSSV